ncbi:MAG: OB-fold nucleic acid binding domain-containing protein [Planctomycetota bacterium]
MTQQDANQTTLETPVQFIKGVGPSRAASLAELGVECAGDLLEYYPRDWVFMPEPVKIADARANMEVCLVGIVEQTDWQPYRKVPIFEITLADDTGFIRVVWFRGRYLMNQLEPGQALLVHGKVAKYKHQLQMSNPKFVILKDDQPRGPEAFSGPVYPASAKLPSWQIKKVMHLHLNEFAALMPELYEAAFLKKNALMPRQTAYQQIHDPENDVPDAGRIGAEALSCSAWRPGSSDAVQRHHRQPDSSTVSVYADRRSGAGHRRSCRGYGQRNPDEPPAAGRCWLGQDGRCAVCGDGGGRE